MKINLNFVRDYLKVPQSHLQFDTPQRESFFSITSSNKLDSRSILGKGSFGTVYSASYRSYNVAVKIICKQSDDENNKFLSLKREANILNWTHKNIVRIFKIVETIDCGAIVMEKFNNGRNLQFILDDVCNLNLCHRLKILRDISSALSYCHSNQICHADLKPLNIMVVVDSNDYVCKLFDFGSSIRICESDDICSQNAGTARYCSPEMLQGRGKITTAIDIFSFGIVMWQLKENEIPYSAIRCNDVVIFQVVKNNLRPDSTILLLNELNEKLSSKEKLQRNNQYCKSDVFDTLKLSPQLNNTPKAAALTNSVNRKKTRAESGLKHRDKLHKSRKNLFMENLKSITVDNESDPLTPKCFLNVFSNTHSYSHENLFEIENNYINLYKACWQEDPSMRPSTEEVYKLIQQFLVCFEP